MRPAPNWRPGRRASGAYRGPMFQCPHCGYATWRTPACAFCGAPSESLATETAHQRAARPSGRAVPGPGKAALRFPTLFLVSFLLGLLVGLASFSPRVRGAGALLLFRPSGQRSQPAVQPGAGAPPPARPAP